MKNDVSVEMNKIEILKKEIETLNKKIESLQQQVIAKQNKIDKIEYFISIKGVKSTKVSTTEAEETLQVAEVVSTSSIDK